MKGISWRMSFEEDWVGLNLEDRENVIRFYHDRADDFVCVINKVVYFRNQYSLINKKTLSDKIHLTFGSGSLSN